MTDARFELAIDLFHQAYQWQMEGDLDLAVDLYKQSIRLYPTAEAHTFLGWTYRYQGKLREAIQECKKAIRVDPTFGNPYNDIGAYLFELGKFDEAIPWLEKAIASQRYDSYHYAWFNLGRVYMAKDLLSRARECYEKALEIEPGYTVAHQALRSLRIKVQ